MLSKFQKMMYAFFFFVKWKSFFGLFSPYDKCSRPSFKRYNQPSRLSSQPSPESGNHHRLMTSQIPAQVRIWSMSKSENFCRNSGVGGGGGGGGCGGGAASGGGGG
jgi:hypothetical protein